MSYFRNQYENTGDNTYNSIRLNTGNNQQRNSFRNPAQRPGSYNEIAPIENYRQTDSPPRRKSLAKLNDFRKKVHQVIDLCKGQNVDVKGQLGQVTSEERQIYNMLSQNPQILQRTVSHQSFPPANQNMQQTIPFRQSQKRDEIITPLRQQKTQNVPQSHYYIPNFSQVGVKQNIYPPNISHSNVLRPDSTYGIQQIDGASNVVYQPYPTLGGGFEHQNGLQNSINKLKNTKQIQLNQDAFRLIQQIQRKAFQQIQKLRRQKLQLMQRLNQQIRNVNQQRRKNLELQSILNRTSNQPQRPDGSSLNSGIQNTQYLQGQINRLQSQLQRANQLNHILRLEISQKGSGIPGIQQLLRQGESIRQQTLRLLKLKQSGDANLRVQELERRLASQQSQKKEALNEIKSLKQRLNAGSQVRQTSFQPSFEKSTVKVRSPVGGRNVGHYEDLVSEMKRITGF